MSNKREQKMLIQTAAFEKSCEGEKQTDVANYLYHKIQQQEVLMYQNAGITRIMCLVNSILIIYIIFRR